MATLVASALVASLASAAPIIRFGQGAKLPPECSVNGIDLDCVATADTPLNFSLIIEIDSSGTAGVSFSAEWDGQLQNALGSASAAQGAQTFIEVDPGPPPVTVSYTPGTSAPTVVDSGASSAGSAQSWNFIANTPASATNLLTAGHSWRAGTLSVTVNDEVETLVQLGLLNAGVDVFLAASGAQLTPTFAVAIINAPEPTAALGLLVGLGSVALLARRSRRS